MWNNKELKVVTCTNCICVWLIVSKILPYDFLPAKFLVVGLFSTILVLTKHLASYSSSHIMKSLFIYPNKNWHMIVELTNHTFLKTLVNDGLVNSTSHHLEDTMAWFAECEVSIS